jgi:hypothetical protein
VTYRARVGSALLSVALLAGLPARAAATITLFGQASTPADNSTNAGSGVTITPPTSMTSGMLVFVAIQVKQTGLGRSEITITNKGGQVWHELNDDSCGTTNVSCRMYAARFNGTWSANPAWDGTVATAVTAAMWVFQESDTSKHFDIDVMPVFNTFAAPSTPFTVTITGVTTATDGAVVLAVWMTADVNTWNTLTSGWSYATSANQVRNTSSAQSMTAAYKVIATAGASGNVSQNEATNGGDAGISFIIAFNTIPAPSTATPTVDVIMDFENSTNGTHLTTTILANGTHGGAGGSWATTGSASFDNNTVSTAAEMLLSSAHEVIEGGTAFNDASATRGVAYNNNGNHNGGNELSFNFTFAASHAKVSDGFYFNTSYLLDGLNSFSSIALFADGSGAFAVWNLDSQFTDQHVARLECNSNVPQLAHIDNNHTYWITILMDTTAGICKAQIYDPSNNWAQYGFTAFTTIATGSNVNRIQILCTGGAFATLTGVSNYDDIAIDYTTASFPLLPGGAGGNRTLLLLGVGQ